MPTILPTCSPHGGRSVRAQGNDFGYRFGGETEIRQKMDLITAPLAQHEFPGFAEPTEPGIAFDNLL